MNLVLASWNVHGWVGLDGRRDPARSFAVIERFEADVVALQEVDGFDWEPLAEAAGYRTCLGPTRGTSFGNALLLRVPLAQVRRLDLSVGAREPRGALDALLQPQGGPIRVITTHLGLRAGERRRQAAQLAQHVDACDASIPTTILGDLNDWTPRGRQLAPIARAIGPLSRVATYPSRRPIFPLDRAACHTPGFVPVVDVLRNDPVRHASDHLPLRVRFSPVRDRVDEKS